MFQTFDCFRPSIEQVPINRISNPFVNRLDWLPVPKVWWLNMSVAFDLAEHSAQSPHCGSGLSQFLVKPSVLWTGDDNVCQRFFQW